MNDERAPDIQLFREDGVWIKPADAERVVLVLAGGEGGSTPGRPGAEGERMTRTYAAGDLPSEVAVEVGRGGRGAAHGSGTSAVTAFPGGRIRGGGGAGQVPESGEHPDSRDGADGFAQIITYFRG